MSTMTGIACGTCHERHATIARVRECAERRWGGFREANVPAQREKPSRQDHNQTRAQLINDVNSLQDSVPAGRYAVIGVNGELNFYQVDKPKTGRWTGYTFLKLQAGPNTEPIKGLSAKRTIFSQIAADPKEASLRYGMELGHCGVCGLELTNAESRARGIGPVCSAKLGW